jgi:hypothetical protein
LPLQRASKDAVVRYIGTQDAHHKKMDYESELITLLKNTAYPTIRNMFLTSLCRTYGAHNSIRTLPTALPWANLPVRLTARGVQWEVLFGPHAHLAEARIVFLATGNA